MDTGSEGICIVSVNLIFKGNFQIQMLSAQMSFVQSWPKVLRMTQILISTKFAASVSLDIFCQMLLWNPEV